MDSVVNRVRNYLVLSNNTLSKDITDPKLSKRLLEWLFSFLEPALSTAFGNRR